MHVVDCLFVAIALLFLSFKVEATPLVVENAVRSKNALGTQLVNYGQIYKNLMNGNRVRYYTDFGNCTTVSTGQDNNQGGEVEYFEHFLSSLTPPDTILFSSQALKLLPKIELTMSTYQTFKDVAFLEISQLNPSTYDVLDSSDYYCNINDGTTGAVYYYTTITTPPNLVTSYNDIYSILKAGSIVTYSIQYDQCDPTPQTGFSGGGAITNYDDIMVNQMNVGIQYLGSFVAAASAWIPNPGLNERSFSLYQNGTVIIDLVTLGTDFSPISSATLSCQMNNGKNNGPASFFTRANSLVGSNNL